jgi:predicted glycosyltransferase
MKLLFYCGHPAQYLFFREAIRQLTARGHEALILIKTKDVLEDLVKADGLAYINILPRERKRSKAAIILSLLKRNARMLPVILKNKPDILIGGDPSVSQLGWLLRKRRFTLTEDDYPVIKTLARLTFPFAQAIVTPAVNNVGKYEHKKVGYNGYMKLAYLHPNVFSADADVPAKYGIERPYALIRLAKLTAHHDFGVKGLEEGLPDRIIGMFSEKGIRTYISAEGRMEEKYSDHRLNIHPADMHHVLAHAGILVSDSQSMSMEAAMLGVPSLRYSSLAGRISVLEELEHRYGLTFGIPAGDEEQLIAKLKNLLSTKDLQKEFQARRQKMLSEKIDVTAFMVWFIENYPESIRIVQEGTVGRLEG